MSGTGRVRSPRVRLSFAWYDLWVGAYIDHANRTLYVCPLPTLLITVRLWSGVHPRLRQPKDWQPPFDVTAPAREHDGHYCWDDDCPVVQRMSSLAKNGETWHCKTQECPSSQSPGASS